LLGEAADGSYLLLPTIKREKQNFINGATEKNKQTGHYKRKTEAKFHLCAK
jgi:hypothetical protein